MSNSTVYTLGFARVVRGEGIVHCNDDILVDEVFQVVKTAEFDNGLLELIQAHSSILVSISARSHHILIKDWSNDVDMFV